MVDWVKKSRVDWVREERALGVGQLIPGQFPSYQVPTLQLPIGWPSGVDYPPEKPGWWPQGLNYPPIGDSWAPVPPGWWTTGEQTGSLPKWPPPIPDKWPKGFPWPIPPSLVGFLPCSNLCDQQFGSKGTTPNQTALDTCNAACAKTPEIGPILQLTPTTTTTPGSPTQTFPVNKFVPTSSTTTKESASVWPWVLGGAAVIGVGWILLRGRMLENAQSLYTTYMSLQE